MDERGLVFVTVFLINLVISYIWWTWVRYSDEETQLLFWVYFILTTVIIFGLYWASHMPLDF